ncbi:MAG: response regulator transcription factor [Vulcanimicrobiota bacterium]
MNKLIYIVEDEKDIADVVFKYLQRDGFNVKVFYRGDLAMEAIRERPPELAILDIMLPGMDGMEILRNIRKDYFFPVIFLTSRKDEVDRILGIELGADDYVTKPFSPRELVAKVKSLFRRIEYTQKTIQQEENKKEIIESRYLTLDLAGRNLYYGKETIQLTTTEFSILQLLMEHPGRVYPREQILELIWGDDFIGETRTVDVHVRNLRKKLEELCGTTQYIHSIRGVGYKFEE